MRQGDGGYPRLKVLGENPRLWRLWGYSLTNDLTIKESYYLYFLCPYTEWSQRQGSNLLPDTYKVSAPPKVLRWHVE